MFRRRSRVVQAIPTASMADIAFLLLVFFMSTTMFKVEDGLPIEMPKAEAAIQIPRERVLHIWIDREGLISVNDKLLRAEQVERVIREKLSANPNLIVAFNTDRRTPFEIVESIMDGLKSANATRVSFTVDFEERGG
ncbi:MAG: ExbD/TolR family protein [bacterium]